MKSSTNSGDSNWILRSDYKIPNKKIMTWKSGTNPLQAVGGASGDRFIMTNGMSRHSGISPNLYWHCDKWQELETIHFSRLRKLCQSPSPEFILVKAWLLTSMWSWIINVIEVRIESLWASAWVVLTSVSMVTRSPWIRGRVRHGVIIGPWRGIWCRVVTILLTRGRWWHASVCALRCCKAKKVKLS